jgi:hypothetical protein
VLKEGLLAYHQKMATTTSVMPYEIYQSLDLGPGSYTLAPSTKVRRGVRLALVRKLKR